MIPNIGLVVLICIFQFNSGFTSEDYDGDDQCVNVTSCESVNWLLENKHKFRTIDAIEVVTIVKNMECAPLKVLCFTTPAEYFMSDISEEDNYFYDYYDSTEETPQGTPNPQSQCSLNILFRINDLAPEIAFSSSTNTTLSTLGMIEEQDEISMEMLRGKNEGDCCWIGYEDEFFQGSNVTFSRGQMKKVDFDLKSIMKGDC
ncbi:hypothetical protein TCAL_04694 [Tigriopus californicus]|uniref:Uncharacterized protein n=1 Tax=Tigriopus californicus TaxID=6832 RepID=A0A553NT37_TIGCA|nr:hypothetical protein TCAL_04694 [Tigriopus californicus]|eukprot:TCALIF_04694-PA protein Name:"Protein of unknown function" AED:0.27 eAED:0.27 QI:1018/1/0.5/1/0/0.5/2/0/201